MITAERAHLHVAARSHPGMSGKNNEDRYAISAFELAVPAKTPSVFAIVSDGIGGHRAGEVAAELAVESISAAIAKSNGEHPIETLRSAILQASDHILAQSEKDSNQKGMGATCACAWVIGEQLFTATVGDSRIYLIRGSRIYQLSIDHTWIQEAVENGVITADQAREHPNAHVIRRYLGSRNPVVPDLRMRLRPSEDNAQAEKNQGLKLRIGDQILLCSDGLTDLVQETEIHAALTSEEQEAALDELVRLANKRGGHDNITMVNLRVPEPPAVPDVTAPAPARRPSRLQITCLGVGALAVLVLVATAAVLWWNIPLPGLLPAAAETATVESPGGLPGTAPLRTQMPTNSTGLPEISTRTPFTFSTATQAPWQLPPSPSPTLTPWPTNTRQP